MKKRFFKSIIVVIVLVAMLSTCAFGWRGNSAQSAPGSFFWGQQDNGPTARELAVLNVMVQNANRSIERLVRIAQLTHYDDVDWLLYSVDVIVAGVMAYAKSIGATVLCEYTEYYIDGQYVLIDPLRVVNV